MSENAYVVVFPSVYSKNKIPQLVSNIKKILKIQGQEFDDVKQDEDVIIIKANDPVFASSAINLLFGIRMVAIAKCIKNDFNSVVDEITKVGSNLLLKGEKFYIQIEGKGNGYLPKDVELSATSALIEKTSGMETKPGTEEDYEKLFYVFLTKTNAYVCIYTDFGLGGIPNNYHKKPVMCCIHDELSAVSCLETIKEGFDARIMVCYQTESDLLTLVRMINQILPRLVQERVLLDFFQILPNQKKLNPMEIFEVTTKLLLKESKKQKINHVSITYSSLMFPIELFDNIIKNSYKDNIIPMFPLAGLDDDVFKSAKEIGLEKYLYRIERLSNMSYKKSTTEAKIKKTVEETIKSKKSVKILVGPKNVHDILDALKIEH